jgi:hypothetical protein
MLIPIPTGYTPPDDVATGDTFEELVTFRMADGGLTPVSIAGVAIAEETSEDVVEDALAEEDMDLGMMGIGQAIMGGAGAPPM